jgi:hypothetical protein
LNRINLLTKTTLTDTIGEGAFNNCTANPGVITGKSSTITALATAIKNAMPTPAN